MTTAATGSTDPTAHPTQPPAAGAAPASLRVARALTEVFAPGNLVMAILLVVGAHAAASWWAGLGWGALAALFCGALPYAGMIYAARRGKLTDRHIRDRRQRLAPLALSICSVLVGAVVLVVGGAPRDLLALVAAMITALLVTTAITARWKISFHAGVAAGVVAVLTLVFGPLSLVGCPVVLAVALSRVRLRDHTPAQVAVGALVGALIATVVFAALR